MISKHALLVTFFITANLVSVIIFWAIRVWLRQYYSSKTANDSIHSASLTELWHTSVSTQTTVGNPPTTIVPEGSAAQWVESIQGIAAICLSGTIFILAARI